MIQAGILDQGTEFFSVGGTLHATHRGQVLHFADLPKGIKNKVRQELKDDPDALEAIKQWGVADPLEQFVECRYGGNDSTADLTAGGQLRPDYHHCGRRGQCPFEGRICINKFGISPREMTVLRLIAQGKMQKEIADILQISEVTIAKHRKKLFQKTGAQCSVDLTRIALQNNFL